ncbi:MAG: glucose-6-phosphate isomerase [Actinomycetes bacterium]
MTTAAFSSDSPVATPAWAALRTLAEGLQGTTIRSLLEADASRPDRLTVDAVGLSLDLSRQRVTEDVLAQLRALAEQRGVFDVRDAMLGGAHINNTEDRAVLHTALRRRRDQSLLVDGQEVTADVHEVLDRMGAFAERVRSGEWKGSTGERIRTIVNIGIGGSDLGPAMAYLALRAFSDRGLDFRFVSNVDPTDLAEAVRALDPATTLFIVASKTFTTLETMTNAQAARTWLVNDLGPDAVSHHFVAVSTNAEAVAEFGIDTTHMFGFWDWVGGRYSMDSAIGLSTMIAIGADGFMQMLDGFRAMDEHFASAPLDANLPVLMGLLAVWNRNFLGIETTAVLPYSQYLSRFPAYLQQLTMESNGKSVRRDGSTVDYETGAIYWGEPGTNGQHSFYQLLHQGTDTVASDIIVVAQSENPDGDQQDMLVANALAQASVLSIGRDAAQVAADGTPPELVPHKVMPGNRPVSVIMIERLDPAALGALVALYEHSVFVQGVIWGIDSFDQWGVELGKKVAMGILGQLVDGVPADVDASTRASIERYTRLR